MPRPVTPLLFPFAGGSSPPNYPAGVNPWSATPVQVQPAYSSFTPDSLVAAQEMNWLLGQHEQFLSDFVVFAGNAPAVNWPYRAGFTTFDTTNGARPVWDPFAKRWLWLARESGILWGQSSMDDGRTWQHIGGSSLTSTAEANCAIGVRPSDGRVVVLTSHFAKYMDPGGAWNAGSEGYGTTDEFHDIVYAGNRFWAQGGVPGSGPLLIDSTDGITWNTQGIGGSSVTSGKFQTATNGTIVVAFPYIDAAGTNYVRIDNTNPSSPTAQGRTPPSANSVQSVAWDSVRQVFVIVENASGDTIIRTSPDGLNWQIMSVVGGVAFHELRCLGSLWAAAVNASDGSLRIYWSNDMFQTFDWKSISDSPRNLLDRSLASAPGQFMLCLNDGTNATPQASEVMT